MKLVPFLAYLPRYYFKIILAAKRNSNKFVSRYTIDTSSTKSNSKYEPRVTAITARREVGIETVLLSNGIYPSPFPGAVYRPSGRSNVVAC